MSINEDNKDVKDVVSTNKTEDTKVPDRKELEQNPDTGNKAVETNPAVSTDMETSAPIRKRGRPKKEMIEEKAEIKKGETVIRRIFPKKTVPTAEPTAKKQGMSNAFKFGIAIGVIATMTCTYFLYQKIKAQREKLKHKDIPKGDELTEGQTP